MQLKAGEPMSFHGETCSTIGRIADAWALEMAGQIGGLTRDEIVARLSAALRAGEFNEALGDGELYLQFQPDRIDGGIPDWDGCYLWSDKPSLDAPTELSPMSRRHQADAVTLNVLARLFRKHGDAATRNRAWLDFFEQATITQGAFAAWVLRTGITPPAFWFSAASGPAPNATASKKRGRPRHRSEDLIHAALSSIACEKMADPTWLANVSIEELRKMVEDKIEPQLKKRAYGKQPWSKPGRTKMREIISGWRSFRLNPNGLNSPQIQL